MRPDDAAWRPAGFTLVQLLLVLVALSILAALALPVVQGALLETRARDMVEDLTTVRRAVLDFHLRYDQWPREGARGRVPPGLEEFLPQGFSFRGPDYVLDYDLWSGGEGAMFQASLEIYTSDREAGRAVMEILGSGVWTDGRTRYVWVLRE